MSKIEAVPFDKEPEDIKDAVVSYWTRRSESFAEHKHAELHSSKRVLWEAEFERVLPKKSGLRILDVGCGSGFFEMVLAPLGHQMTGVDLTPEMIAKGQALLQHHELEATLQVMDAEKLKFADESFDAVISRNLTWTLPHPVEAYREWMRVLKPGGTLVVFDAEYAKGYHRYDQVRNCSHAKVTDDMKEECHRMYHMLSISAFDRPQWDVQVLQELGFHDVVADSTVGDHIYATQDEFYMPDRMFSIRAVK